MGTEVLSINNLELKFTKTVVTIDNLVLEKKSTLAIVGESGSGKSLTALAIMQLLPDTCKVSKNAKINYAGKNLLDISEYEMQNLRGKRISMIFQEALSALNPVKTIGQQIKEVLVIHKIVTKDFKRHILEILNEVNLQNPEKVYNSYPHQLSGGMNQRAMIAIAIASKPQILIADEPTTALDVSIQTKIMALINKLKEKYNMSIIFITHDLSVVQDYADKVAVMKSGKVLELKNKIEFFKKPEHSYSRKLLSATTIQPIVEQKKVIQDKILRLSGVSSSYFTNSSFLMRKKTFGVSDINFDLSSGESLAIIGESGSGKTTIAKTILQLQKIERGTISLFGQNLKNKNKRNYNLLKDSIQIIFQNPDTSMNPRFTVQQILEEGLKARKKFYSKEKISDITDNIMREVGLDPSMKSRYPHEFSGGQKQRICIARALSIQPKIIICDEPTSALDISIQGQIIKLLKSLQQKSNLSYILITHDFSLVSSFADKVIVMRAGKIVEAGSTKEVLTEPKDNYTKELLESIPKMQSTFISKYHKPEVELYES
ncbi:MAG: ABC transporter ATP-binding protein [Pseudomonadota bacterium]|nr:ABC transporter ATP-binding protein [Pseudomonadota bacterium]